MCALATRPSVVTHAAVTLGRAGPSRRITRRYTRYLEIVGERPGGALRNQTAATALLRWAAAEREAWLDAFAPDPLLPERILPSDYLGKAAWQRRVELLRDAARQLRTFNL